MKPLLPVVWMLVAITLSGCSQWNLVRPGMIEQVDVWLVEKEYGKVLEHIETLPPTHADYAALHARLPEIRSLVTNFEKDTVVRAERLARKKQWQEALELYDKGLARLPNSATMDAARTQLLARRAARSETLRNQALLEKGEWLTRNTPLRREIARLNPYDWQARQRLKENSREVETVAAELYSCGQRALSRDDDKLALQCLNLAHTLTPTETISAALARAKTTAAKHTAKRNGERRRHSQARASTIQQIVHAYEKAYADGDLLQAREHVNRLSGLEPNDTAIKRMETDLNVAIELKIKHGIETGRTLYSRGQIQPALETWSDLMQLEPDNEELNAHIARAQRVLEKLHKLKKKGTGDASNSP